MTPFQRFFSFALKYRTRYILGLFALLFTDLFALLTPRITGFAIDCIKSISERTPIKANFYFAPINLAIEKWAVSLIEKDPFLLIIVIGAAIVSVNIIAGMFRVFWRLFIMKTSYIVEYDIRNSFYDKILSMPIKFFLKNSQGELMSRATNDLGAVRMMAGPGILALFDPLFMALIAIPNMLLIEPKLTGYALLPLPFIAVLVLIFQNLIFKTFKQVQARFSNMTEFSQNSFMGIKIIKGFTKEDSITKKFNRYSDDYRKVFLKLVRYESLFHPMIMFFSSISIVVILYFGGVQAIKGNVSLGNFYAFTRYLLSLVWPMIAIGWVISLWQRGLASMHRINDILLQRSDIISGNNKIEKIESIEFKDVHFKYPDSIEWTLRGVSFLINNNDKVAFVGKIGSGKSTLVELILRFYDVQRGEILINGINIRQYDLALLRRSIGYVPQDSFLFSESLKDNLVLSNGEIIEELERSIKYAGLAETIANFNEGLNTIVGEKGITLSGGQRQRMTIARAIYSNPPCIIFDDSFSSIDTNIEKQILSAFDNFNETIQIFISHRISTIENVDRIYVLKKGEVVEMGKIGELLRLKGEFYKVYLTQQLSEEG